MGPIGCPKTSVKITTIRCVIFQQSGVLMTATVRIAVTMWRVRVTTVYVKKTSITYSECAYLVLIIQHTKACAVLSHVTYLTNGSNFGKNAIEYKMCVLIFSTTFA